MFLKRLNKIKETNKIAVLLLIFSFLASQFLYTVPISVFAAENASPDLGQNPICNPNINLVKNGSFEKPAIGGSWNIFSSVPNWSVDWIGGPNSFGNITRPTKGLLEIQKNVNNWLPSKGEQYAELDTDWDGPNGTNDGEPSSVVIWQNLETISGGTYKLSVDFSPRPDTPKEDNILGILWGGVAVSNTPITASGKNISNTVWTTHTFNLLANSNNTELRFSDLGKQNSLGTFIDNISVTCVPKATPPPSPTNTPPTITLLGDNPLEWNLNELFVDPGATAKDLEDGDATTTENIIVTGTVNASTTGSYILTYSVTDSGGLSASTTREVKVVDNATPPIVPPILPPGGGGGGGGGLGGHRHSVVTGEVLGATTCSYLKDYLKIDRQNDPIEVLKLQSFLNVFEGENLSLTGVFNQATLGAVERFQVKYSKDILKPWGKNVTTGYVYILTKKKINEIYCNSVINLSQNDKNEITAFKAFGENNPNVVINNPAVGFLSTPDNSLNVLNSNSSSSPTVTLKDNSSTTVANNNSALKNIAVSILAFPKKIFSGGGYTFTFLLLILVAVIIALIKLFAGPKHSNNVPITPIAETNDDKKTESPVIILPGVLPDEEIVVENPEEEPDEVIIDTPDLRSTDKKDKN